MDLTRRCCFAFALVLSSCFSITVQQQSTPSDSREAYFNGSSYIHMFTTISYHSHVGISFRSCAGGEIFSQRHKTYSTQLSALPDYVSLTFKSNNMPTIETKLPLRSLDNRWHYVGIVYQPPNLIMNDGSGHSVIVANVTYNPEVLTTSEFEDETSKLIVGSTFNGCMMEGPSLVFNKSQMNVQGVTFGKCPLSNDKCVDRRNVLTTPPVDHCMHEPCMRHGICVSRADKYECHCSARYAGNNCQIDNGPPCDLGLCRNGGTCEETKVGDYMCICQPGYYGKQCELELNVNSICLHNPCFNNGTCTGPANSDKYVCTCLPGFTGQNCEINIDDCAKAPQPPCLNGGICQDGINNYTCMCTNTGYTGSRCEINVNECESLPNPCLNDGICFDTYGGYVCHCKSGYMGNNCQLNQNECLSLPCMNGGTCVDLQGSYRCDCPKDTIGPKCALRRTVRCVNIDCPPNSSCADPTGSIPMCVCDPSFQGEPGPNPNCTLVSTEMCMNNTCANGGTCIYNREEDTFDCKCLPGYTGEFCEQSLFDVVLPSPRSGGIVRCSDQPCIHAISCEDYSHGYFCECEPGWKGINCQREINECYHNPCHNGAECVRLANSFSCDCLPGYTGKTCQTIVDLCASHPCQNGGTCIHQINSLDFQCKCPPGFDGKFCEDNIDDCLDAVCPEFQVCYDGINNFVCRCPDGFIGENCTVTTDFCASNPCVNGTCKEGGGGNDYTCTCNNGYTGKNCDLDIDECQDPGICNHGICINKQGSYQCYCKPGYTGEHCDVDFDECLSRPCQNNGTCINKINNYECICTPGFKGKDCSIDIDECESNPCKEGSTCINGMATFTCVCVEGLTGPTCETNIDDCESMPCYNGGLCLDGLNNYTCDCTDTGHSGPQCEFNIDDCESNPCVHDSVCMDMVKDYKCNCYPGYTGKNCEIDIPECDSSPCQYRGVCLERSNVSLYQNISYNASDPVYINQGLNMRLPIHFFQEFSYNNASGFECVCISGITGAHCEINIDECESSPCGPWGTCVDRVGRYDCECNDGFEGDHCQRDIDECAKHKPCVKGICHDRRANYYCECEPGWGGKNCSVALQGCTVNQCLNGGTCRPWLQSETEHRFNCTCSAGFYGNTCEKITTMSLGGHSFVAVNTTRDEGYDIQFRFKTTLGNGLLAIGKGLTFYILELVAGRLNLHSSLLNKWEGVFIGSGLNDSKWQKVFVAINSSHLVLAANEEQTIYPINLNEGSNSSHTSFPTTYLGGTINSLSRLTHGPAYFVGCVEDVIINSEWVLPADSPNTEGGTDSLPLVDTSGPITLSSQTASWSLYGVQTRCPRVAQCGPKNPCHSGGRCTDLWTSYLCSCQRPYLGRTCQYNVTAATFGHENITNSLVTVIVNDNARRAVRSIADISMFIRTRKPSGQIFYLGSKPSSQYSEETFIAASLVNGEFSIHLKFNQTYESYAVGGNRLDNGYNHLIQVIRNSTLIQLKLNGSEYFRKPISATGQLDAQVLYLGGYPPLSPIRAIRQADLSNSNGGLINIHANLRAEPISLPGTSVFDLAQVDHFKGVIQDVQISNGSRTMIVEFFPLKVHDFEMPISFGTVSFDNSTILEGVVSDDSCADNPCLHNGTCKITWNDFSCTCPRGYKGKSCQEMEFCQLQDCPIGSVCQNLDDGYECIANATFDGFNTTLAYNLTLIENLSKEDEQLTANSITIEYRSKTGGTLLHIENTDREMLSISVFRDQVAIQWLLPPLQVPKLERFRKSQPDFKWTRIHFEITKNQIKGGFSDWVKEDSPSFTSEFDIQAWINLLKTGEIRLGGVHLTEENTIETSTNNLPFTSSPNYIPKNFSFSENSRFYGSRNLYIMDNERYERANNRKIDYQNDGLFNANNVDLQYPTESDILDNSGVEFWKGSEGTVGENFKGCLGEIRIGNLLLPFYTLSELYPNDNLLQAGHYYFSLQADKQYPTTQLGCTLCFNRDCLNGGHCSEPETSYACNCPVGFTGDDCGTDVDECATNNCQNNATCVDGIGNYTCICQPGWEGWLCDIDIDECLSQPCKNGGTCTDLPGAFHCDCPNEFTGPDCASPKLLTCAHRPCRAGSTCLDQKDSITGNNFTCACMPGLEGVLCDTPYCMVKPCLNGGQCDSTPDTRPVCKCPLGFMGKYCEINIDECKTQDGTSPCLNGGRCIDGIASYVCDCSNTGYTGVNCEQDINECIQNHITCGDGGTCINIEGSYECLCGPNKCGDNCSIPDPCSIPRLRAHDDSVTDGESSVNNTIGNDTILRGPCENGGICKSKCKATADYECHCVNNWGGKNCTEYSMQRAEDDSIPVGIIVGAVVGGLCALGGIGLVVTCMLARSKRATRGTYSPSGQEYRNPRLEMLDSVLKPPPEERLI